MKIVATELQTAVSVDTADPDYPAANALSDYTADRYQNVSGDHSATFTVTVAAGGANVFGVSYTNADLVVYSVKNNLGATVASGSISLTSPRRVDRIWKTFTAQSANCTVVLAMGATSGQTLYVGRITVGVYTEITMAIEAIREAPVCHQNVVPLAAPGADWVQVLRGLRAYSLTVRKSQAGWYQLRTIYLEKGASPMLILLSSEFGSTEDNEWSIYGKISMDLSAELQRGGGSAGVVYTTIEIKEQG